MRYSLRFTDRNHANLTLIFSANYNLPQVNLFIGLNPLNPCVLGVWLHFGRAFGHRAPVLSPCILLFLWLLSNPLPRFDQIPSWLLACASCPTTCSPRRRRANWPATIL